MTTRLAQTTVKINDSPYISEDEEDNYDMNNINGISFMPPSTHRFSQNNIHKQRLAT